MKRLSITLTLLLSAVALFAQPRPITPAQKEASKANKSVVLVTNNYVAQPPGDITIPAEKGHYGAGLTYDVFGSVRTPDLQKERLGIGVGVTLWNAAGFGLGVEAIQESFRGTLDEANLLVHYRVPIGKGPNALDFFAGGGRNLYAGRYNILFGGGVERKIGEYYGVFFDARLVKTMDRDAAALARLGLRFSF